MIADILPVANYDCQLTEKIGRLNNMMTPFQAPAPEVFRSPVSHYRMRAEFRIWHEGEELWHVLFDPQTKQRITVKQFPAACMLINRLMTALIASIKRQPVLRNKLFQIDYLATRSGKIIASMLYHRPLDDEWRQHAIALRDQLRKAGFDLQLIGRASRLKILLDQEGVDEILPVAGREIIYRQVENSFTQPNAAINVHMLEWATRITVSSQGDLLELYCGNGNFSLALASNFRRVLATEIAKASVAAAHYNIAINQIDNVRIVRMSTTEFIQAIQGVRNFNRLKNLELTEYHYETVFVNPPRCGLDNETIRLLQTYPKILYISCNPQTLCNNLILLKDTHDISHLALFDQFPYTHHMECGLLLEKRLDRHRKQEQ